MSEKPFVHLHLHTSYSLLDGACRVDQLMDAVAAHNMPAVAITDHGVMYGVIDFYNAARERGIKPIVGCEAYVAVGSHKDRKSEGHRTHMNHLVLLATNETGYHNLIRLVSLAQLDGFYYKPRIDKELLAAHHEGLIGLSACLKGEVASHLLNDNMDAAVTAAETYREILGENNFFLEIMDHGLPEQRKVNMLTKDLCARTGLQTVATNDVHYLQKDHADAHEVLLCLQTQTVMSDEKRMRYRSKDFYLKSQEEMAALFKDFPGSTELTLEIAERCNLELEFNKPHFPSFAAPDSLTQKDYLARLGKDGIKHRYNLQDPDKPQTDEEKRIMGQFDLEMGVIDRTGFINYFLVVWDFVRFAREQDIPVGPGRGSGGGSLVAYVLGITDIDPLAYGLIFERFLNPERVSPPDFDIDFCQSRRGEVIDYVKDKYGRDNVAQIITFGSLGAKTVIRDVGRVLEIPYSYCDRLSKMVPDDPKIKLKAALEISLDFKKAYDTEPDCKRILDYGFVLEGLSRNAGTHAAGVVIGEKPLIEIIPLARDKEKEVITQYSMEPLGEIGLLKMDFLGLKTLTVIKETLDIIQEGSGREINLNELPFDDEPTYDLLNRGDTVGVFQLESTGMRDLIRRVGIDRIEDLIAMIALYRPGPMNMLEDYVKRKSGQAKIKYDHPLLEDILKETYGVMLYQEQVQKSANILAGYSLGEADVLRRAMGKKKEKVMEEQRTKFIDGCAKTHRIRKEQAGRIFDTMAKFAGYGFNKAHSAGYAIISYQTAYLKANYPAEFMSALLSSEIGNFDKIPVFIVEAKEMGLEILPPDVNNSGVRFRPSEAGIRFGLAGIKNVGQGAAVNIVAEREQSQGFSGLIDFCSRADGQLVNKKVLENLIRSGAMTSINEDRARLFNAIDFAMSRAATALRDKRSGQASLFDMLGEETDASSDADLPDCAPWHESDLLAGERELLGMYMTGHPLTQYAPLLERYQLTTVQEFGKLKQGTGTRLGGIISEVTVKVTKATKLPMAFIQLEDLDGQLEVVVIPEVYRDFQGSIHKDAAILVCGDVSRNDDTPKLLAYEIYSLADAPKYFATRVGVHIPAAHLENGRLERLRDILRMHPGRVKVTICIQFPSGKRVFVDTDKAFRVLPDQELITSLEHELGEKSVYVAVNPSPLRKEKPKRRWGRNNQS